MTKAMPEGHSIGTPLEPESENPIKTSLRLHKTSSEPDLTQHSIRPFPDPKEQEFIPKYP